MPAVCRSRSDSAGCARSPNPHHLNNHLPVPPWESHSWSANATESLSERCESAARINRCCASSAVGIRKFGRGAFGNVNLRAGFLGMRSQSLAACKLGETPDAQGQRTMDSQSLSRPSVELLDVLRGTGRSSRLLMTYWTFC